MISHTTIVYTRYIILGWIRRNRNAQKTYGELFYMFCEDIQDMDLVTALQRLMFLFKDIVAMVSVDITDLLKNKVSNWLMSHRHCLGICAGKVEL